jgi:Uma2 family endonuclease
MVLSLNTANTTKAIRYPDSNGEPISDNTLQFQWIVMLQGEIASLFSDREDVFVAGDLLWYPVEGQPTICVAPDTLIAFGRPKGYRGSYKQWEENNIPPQVVFEVLSPGNHLGEMARKLSWYERYGVMEYYLIDPEKPDLTGYLRYNDRLEAVETINGWTSPLLQISFELSEDDLTIYRPDKRPFVPFTEMANLYTTAHQLVIEEREKAEHEREKAERLVNELRKLGIDPDKL